jgi:hypothetical protein
VNTATEKWVASTRCCASACDDTSIATASLPSSTMAASPACSSGASGVVRAPVSVPMSPVDQPWASRIERSRWVVVVLPFVPVTPTTRSSRDGWPWKAAANGAMAARTDATCTWVASTGTGRSTSRAAAPAVTACAAKSWPSARCPGTQQNSVPRRTPRESWVTSEISTAGSPRSSTTSTSPSRTRRSSRSSSTGRNYGPDAGGMRNSRSPYWASRLKTGADTWPAV